MSCELPTLSSKGERCLARGRWSGHRG